MNLIEIEKWDKEVDESEIQTLKYTTKKIQDFAISLMDFKLEKKRNPRIPIERLNEFFNFNGKSTVTSIMVIKRLKEDWGIRLRKAPRSDFFVVKMERRTFRKYREIMDGE
jgi:hypothetical protein